MTCRGFGVLSAGITYPPLWDCWLNCDDLSKCCPVFADAPTRAFHAVRLTQ